MEHTVIRDIYYILPIVEAAIRGYCFYRLVKSFMLSGVKQNGIYALEGARAAYGKEKEYAVCVGVVYFLVMLLLYIIPLPMDAYVAYSIGSLIMFLFICLIDRRNYKQKAFLVAVFFL